MQKVAVITGVTGQDGSLLSRHLLDIGWDKVVGVQRRTSTSTDWRLKELNLYDDDRFTVASGDITDAGSIARIVQQWQPTHFYNLAAMSFVGESWNTPAATMEINAIGCVNCLEALRHHKKDCHFYQASSSEMFGGKMRTEIFDENSKFYPRSPYGVSKVAAHDMVVNYRESFDMFCCNGILFNHESEYRGLEFVTRKITDGVAKIKLGMQEKIYLGNLDAKRDWGYAGDFVRGMQLMLDHREPDDFVLATGTARSIREFVQASVNMADLKEKTYFTRYVQHDAAFNRPADVGHLLDECQKAKDILGWVPEVSFDEMVNRMISADIERNENANN